jgi:MFS family permease
MDNPEENEMKLFKPMLLKPNTLITILYDVKNSKTYMLDKTSKKIYYHSSKFGNLNSYSWMGWIIAMFILPQVFLWIEAELSQRFLLEDINMLLIISVILMGLICSFITRRKSYTPVLKEYLSKHIDAEELHNSREVLDKAYTRSVLMITIPLASLAISIYQFVLFFEESEFINFRYGLIAYTLFSITVVFLFDAIFVARYSGKADECNDSEDS